MNTVPSLNSLRRWPLRRLIALIAVLLWAITGWWITRVTIWAVVLFLPLVFLAAALPIAAAHLGTSQAAWILFFSGSAPKARILAYSLAAHFTFMLCNGLIGLLFLLRATRELTAVQQMPSA